jgi:hypothetical protein
MFIILYKLLICLHIHTCDSYHSTRLHLHTCDSYYSTRLLLHTHLLPFKHASFTYTLAIVQTRFIYIHTCYHSNTLAFTYTLAIIQTRFIYIHVIAVIQHACIYIHLHSWHVQGFDACISTRHFNKNPAFLFNKLGRLNIPAMRLCTYVHASTVLHAVGAGFQMPRKKRGGLLHSQRARICDVHGQGL